MNDEKERALLEIIDQYKHSMYSASSAILMVEHVMSNLAVPNVKFKGVETR